MSESNFVTAAFDSANIMQRNGILHGISWRQYLTNPAYPNANRAPELHIGMLQNYQIHLSKNNPASTDGNAVYCMQLWEMTVVPQSNDNGGTVNATPQYTILIPNGRIEAPDLDEAKVIAVQQILQYITDEHNAAEQRFQSMVGLFGDLNKHLVEKTFRRRSAEPIESLGLDTYTVNALQKNGIRLIGELSGKTKADIRNLNGISTSTLNKLLTCLHKANLQLADETTYSITVHDIKMEEAANKAAQAEQAAHNDEPDSAKTADDDSNAAETAPDAAEPNETNADAGDN